MRSLLSDLLSDLAGAFRIYPTLAARALCFGIAVPALLRLKLTSLDALLDRPAASKRAPPAEDAINRIVACVDFVWSAGRRLLGWACLHRGLTLYYFLRRTGVDVELCFGATPDGPTAHCWLVRDGLPYLERVDPRGKFFEMYVMPGKRRVGDSVR
jgi:hypothetical protein